MLFQSTVFSLIEQHGQVINSLATLVKNSQSALQSSFSPPKPFVGSNLNSHHVAPLSHLLRPFTFQMASASQFTNAAINPSLPIAALATEQQAVHLSQRLYSHQPVLHRATSPLLPAATGSKTPASLPIPSDKLPTKALNQHCILHSSTSSSHKQLCSNQATQAVWEPVKVF